jgi:hypothetical protein
MEKVFDVFEKSLNFVGWIPNYYDDCFSDTFIQQLIHE